MMRAASRWALLLALRAASALPNGLASTPPLGWSSWLTCEPGGGGTCVHDFCNEGEVKAAAEAMQANGMQALGWRYIVLDDCWARTSRDAAGRLTWDPARFPSGIPALVDWMHARGFLFGLYTSAGDVTCSSGGRNASVPGSRGHFEVDTKTFATWQLDYVKLDWCGDAKKEPWVGARLHEEFAAAMNATARPMVLEVVTGYFFLRERVSEYANTWRFCEDHKDHWKSTTEQLECRALLQHEARGAPGGWAYMDVLTTGGAGCLHGGGAHCAGQSADEYRTEAAIWAITQSPLLVATDVRARGLLPRSPSLATTPCPSAS